MHGHHIMHPARVMTSYFFHVYMPTLWLRAYLPGPGVLGLYGAYSQRDSARALSIDLSCSTNVTYDTRRRDPSPAHA